MHAGWIMLIFRNGTYPKHNQAKGIKTAASDVELYINEK